VSAERILLRNKRILLCLLETEENKQETALYPGGRKCIIDDSRNNRINIFRLYFRRLKKKVIRKWQRENRNKMYDRFLILCVCMCELKHSKSTSVCVYF
jgi:hypothetical protein